MTKDYIQDKFYYRFKKFNIKKCEAKSIETKIQEGSIGGLPVPILNGPDSW